MESRVTKSTPEPKRVVLLGASNLTRAFGLAVETARRLLGGPLEVVAALGHGRSYGMYSRVLGRGLVGISECGLWRALDAAPSLPSYALLTDIGNDILYEAGRARIIEWLETCVDRLSRHDARITIATLPLKNLEGLGRARFLAARSVLFPGRTITLETVREEAMAIDLELRRLAVERGLAIVEPDPGWYGVDPVHIKKRYWPQAWHAKLTPWVPGSSSNEPATTGPPGWAHARPLRPDRWRLFGKDMHRSQPCLTLTDGTRISLY